ncbi:tetratricopeptide repeat protein [Criblamydia sequanensis]|uniref:TPR repeat-containing protein n=1 Tax=Candidatus Criblamydia sequanensis CRIB-18 TaxID=1437425 RepID=A0A090CZ37_9BACT|nr:hypothetical protein [Criblamydia sequanensis]CDR34142.1 Conserved hypothetical protein [Criblamydia sequanensis CRIB-18]
MEKTPYLNLFEKILSEKQFSSLDSFREPESWKGMSFNEKELLAILFVLQGNDLAAKGDQTAASKNFKLAAKAAPNSAKIFFKLGNSYIEMGKSLRNLKSACRYYQKALTLDPNFYEAWVFSAFAETIFSELCQDPKLFHEAQKKFETALKMCRDLKFDEDKETALFYKWGLSLYRKAKLSGEPCDYNQALLKLRAASCFKGNSSDFWNDYGNILAEQGTLIGQLDYFKEAKYSYRQSLKLKPNQMACWLNLACSSMKLYENSFSDEDYDEAEKAFQKASELDSNNLTLWLFWGSLELLSAKVTRDADKLHSAIEKFELADVCEPNNPETLLRLGEALMNLGAQEEQFEILKEAEEKIQRSLSLDSERAETWYFYGRCFTEQGRYFHDINFFVKAIEKYHHGLRVDPSFHVFHYGIALCYMEMADHKIESEYLECSIRHFARLCEYPLTLPAQFWLDYGIALLRHAELKRDKVSAELAVGKIEKSLILQEHTFLSPLFMDTLFNYASAIQILGDLIEDPMQLEKAVKFFSHIIKEEPSYTPARIGLAHSLFHLGEMLSDADCLKEAWDVFEQILLEDPEDEMAWGDLGALIVAYAELTKDPIKLEENQWLMNIAEQKLQTSAYLGNEGAYYTLACVHSIKGNLLESLHYIEKAIQARALPPIEDIMHDDWLCNLRSSQEFRFLLSRFFKDSA